ncbi:MAG TPA: Slp family lipoprotein [Nitrospiria bacterium]|nr:Slp family lipoprotein [Nitrospiria bacterium]
MKRARPWAGAVEVIALFLILIAGCAPRLIPEELAREIDPALTLERIRENVDAQLGKRILLGGEIIEVRPLEGKSEIEILEKPLDDRQVPLPVDASAGKFILIHPGPMDASLFRSGRRATVVGKVAGSRTTEGSVIPVLDELFIRVWPPQGVAPESRISIGIGFGTVIHR